MPTSPSPRSGLQSAAHPTQQRGYRNTSISAGVVQICVLKEAGGPQGTGVYKYPAPNTNSSTVQHGSQLQHTHFQRFWGKAEQKPAPFLPPSLQQDFAMGLAAAG